MDNVTTIKRMIGNPDALAGWLVMVTLHDKDAEHWLTRCRQRASEVFGGRAGGAGA